MRRDLDRVSEDTAQSVEDVQNDFDNTYDLLKFVIGVLALGLLALVAPPLLSLFKGGSGS